ncbi:hypothetical protein PRIPAC_95333 [Pristionchus pacificus]|uniref:Uncharacterized protein n=1 Tax=Pristionchus pacificus TaxID=54126 RepID=A0A2A6BCP8_PRIPA|nr:hypothetical protein PRIPAC_95333 [Pristionchus pacificus]|eukprot:PDM63648.1 hypothetical protein PRIPAC_49621 [Pristionchus pacificus]
MFSSQCLVIACLLASFVAQIEGNTFLRARRYDEDEIDWDAHVTMCGDKVRAFAQKACNICADSPKFERIRDRSKGMVILRCCTFECSFRDIVTSCCE